jgi:hypothetical protein
LPVRWMAIAASSDPDLVPPDLKSEGCRAPDSRVACAALVGARDPITGAPVDVAAGATLRLRRLRPEEQAHGHEHHEEGQHSEEATVEIASDTPEILFQMKLAQPSQIERQEFNKWMLRTVGSMAYLPEQAIVVMVPMAQFTKISDLFDRSFGASAGLHGAESAPPYLPEMMHLVALDRDRWISPWRFEASLDALAGLQRRLYDEIRDVTIFSYVASDTFATLTRMYQIDQLIGVVTLLVAIPLLWLSWAVANMLSGLLLMNERRLIGLALIRGVPAGMISRSLVTALVLGGTLGSALGLVLGASVTVGAQRVWGAPVPPLQIILHGLVYFLIFALVSVVIAVMSGWSIIRWVREMTPREAIAHVSSGAGELAGRRPSVLSIMTSIALLVLGSYKLIGWVKGVNPIDALTIQPWAQGLRLCDGLLNFVAIPFLLFGITSLLRLRVRWVQYALGALSVPIAGRLSWFVAQHMTTNRQRVAGTVFIASLAMSLALLPQVAADTFEHRMFRGVDTAIGSDVQIEYGANDLSADARGLKSAAAHRAAFGPRLTLIERAIRSDPNVRGITALEQYIAPDVYVPNQQGLLINLLQSTDDYLRLTYAEPGLGVGRPFDSVIRSGADGSIIASTGLLQIREVPLGRNVALGFNGETPVLAKFRDRIGFLPGQPSIDVAQREGYAPAEVDYLNYLLSSDARAVSTVATFEHAPLNALQLLPSRYVFLVRMARGGNEGDIHDLIRILPFEPQAVRWQAQERRRLSRDMFISLALADMRVFMIGGLVLAIAGVVVVGLANFLSERRTFSLLRLRGLPFRTILRISLAMFLAPVLAGILLGVVLGIAAGFGFSEAVWRLPRVYGVAGLLANNLALSTAAGAIVAGFGASLLMVALGFALWPFRGTANESLRGSG